LAESGTPEEILDMLACYLIIMNSKIHLIIS